MLGFLKYHLPPSLRAWEHRWKVCMQGLQATDGNHLSTLSQCYKFFYFYWFLFLYFFMWLETLSIASDALYLILTLLLLCWGYLLFFLVIFLLFLLSYLLGPQRFALKTQLSTLSQCYQGTCDTPEQPQSVLPGHCYGEPLISRASTTEELLTFPADCHGQNKKNKKTWRLGVCTKLCMTSASISITEARSRHTSEHRTSVTTGLRHLQNNIKH